MAGRDAPGPTKRLLLVSPEPGSARSRRLSGIFTPSFSVRVESGPAPALDGVDAVVVDAPSSGARLPWLERLEEFVRGGGRLLVLLGHRPLGSDWAEWLGADTGEIHPAGEWFFKPSPAADGLADRLAGEIAVLDSPVELALTAPGMRAVASVSVAFRDRVVMSLRQLGEGSIVLAGVGVLETALANPDIARLLSRAVRSPAGRRAPLGLAVLGYGPYGGMGLYHGLAAKETAGLEMVAAADPDPARRQAAQDEFPGLRAYGDLEGLAADEEVDIAVVATPPSSHFELARKLLEAGKHVVLEKPMCLKVTEADELITLARRQARVLTVHQSRRWDPDFQALARAVADGRIGELFNVETFVGGFEHPCRAWHSEVEVSGGAVYDWGSHHLDWILQLMGDFPAELTAHGHKRVWRDVTNLDQVRVRLTWPDGREAEFLQSDVAGIRRPKFFVQGTGGTIAGHYRPLRFETLRPGYGYVGETSHHAEAPVELTLARYEPGYGLTETLLPPGPLDRYGFHRNLADHLLCDEPLAVTAESAREVVALLEAAQISTDKGNVTISLSRPGA